MSDVYAVQGEAEQVFETWAEQQSKCEQLLDSYMEDEEQVDESLLKEYLEETLPAHKNQAYDAFCELGPVKNDIVNHTDRDSPSKYLPDNLELTKEMKKDAIAALEELKESYHELKEEQKELYDRAAEANGEPLILGSGSQGSSIDKVESPSASPAKESKPENTTVTEGMKDVYGKGNTSSNSPTDTVEDCLDSLHSYLSEPENQEKAVAAGYIGLGALGVLIDHLRDDD